MIRFVPLLFLFACEGTNPDYPPPSPLPADLVTCSAPADCVIVELVCCDACNGGTAVAVRADMATSVRDTYSETCPNDVACTELGCAPTVADCVADVCVITEPATTQ